MDADAEDREEAGGGEVPDACEGANRMPIHLAPGNLSARANLVGRYGARSTSVNLAEPARS